MFIKMLDENFKIPRNNKKCTKKETTFSYPKCPPLVVCFHPNNHHYDVTFSSNQFSIT